MLRVHTDGSEQNAGTILPPCCYSASISWRKPLTKIVINIVAELTFLSFAAVVLWATVVGYDGDFR